MNETQADLEVLTIADRMCRAFDTVELLATNNFTPHDSYKQAHQVLYTSIRQFEDDGYGGGALRFVEDVIPASNLVRYGRYTYNEGRERMYTSSPRPQPAIRNTLADHGHARDEPWMHATVERMFHHTLLSSTYNFNLYEAEIERFDKIDEYPDGNLSDVFPLLFMAHSRSPVKNAAVDHTLSSSSGKTIPASDLPYYLRLDDDHVEGNVLRSRIQSGYVRNLWMKPSISDKERSIEVYRSLLENYFFHDEESRALPVNNHCIPRQANLQDLVNSISSLNNKIPKHIDEFPRIPHTSSSTTESNTPPTRRLYSDVVQGNKSQEVKNSDSWMSSFKDETNGYDSGTDITAVLKSSAGSVSSTSAQFDEDRINEVSLANALDALVLETEGSSTSSMSMSPRYRAMVSPLKSYSDVVGQSGSCDHHHQQPSIPQAYEVFAPTTTPVYDPQLNAPPGMRGYSPIRNYVPYTSYSNYRMPYNRNPTMVRAPPPGFPSRPPLWHAPAYRPAPYNLMLPQLPSKHRWPYPHFVRPPIVPTAMYPPPPPVASNPQMWPPPPPPTLLNQSTSSQQVDCFTLHEAPPFKSKKKSWKFPRSCTPEGSNKTHVLKKWTPLPLGPISTSMVSIRTSHKTTTTSVSIVDTCEAGNAGMQTSPEYPLKLLSREVEQQEASTSRTSITVFASDSDDLERIALREYQSSNDMFFTEIERQATEQYDGNPENSCRPPTTIVRSDNFLGGLELNIGFLFHLCLCFVDF